MVRNVYETEINGQKIGFKCGSLAVAIACREAKAISVQDLFIRMAAQDLLAILAIFYGSACQYASMKGEQNPSMDNVSDWIEAMGEEKAQEATVVLLDTFKKKAVTKQATESE